MHWSQEFIYAGTWAWHPGALWFTRAEQMGGMVWRCVEPDPFRAARSLLDHDEALIPTSITTYDLARFDVYSYSSRAHIYAMQGDRGDLDRMLALLDMAMRFLVFVIDGEAKGGGG